MTCHAMGCWPRLPSRRLLECSRSRCSGHTCSRSPSRSNGSRPLTRTSPRGTGSRHIRLLIDDALHRDQLRRALRQVAPSSSDSSDAIGGQTDEIKVVAEAGPTAQRMKCRACTKKADSVRFAIGLNDMGRRRCKPHLTTLGTPSPSRTCLSNKRVPKPARTFARSSR